MAAPSRKKQKNNNNRSWWLYAGMLVVICALIYGAAYLSFFYSDLLALILHAFTPEAILYGSLTDPFLYVAVRASAYFLLLFGVVLSFSILKIKGYRYKSLKKHSALLAILLLILIGGSTVMVWGRFYVTPQGITDYSRGVKRIHDWKNIKSVELKCMPIHWGGRYSRSTYVPSYILNFDDGRIIDLWFGSYTTSLHKNGRLQDFVDHYPAIKALIPASIPVSINKENFQQCRQYCSDSFARLHDPVIDKLLASVAP
ncbi:MAG: hypothetical protein SFW62_04745 [Alphaproteobacteria bacterium]|nr:hypothetical protein [Alphaproteobacteria bacterium]